jgi:hypothetical protein
VALVALLHQDGTDSILKELFVCSVSMGSSDDQKAARGQQSKDHSTRPPGASLPTRPTEHPMKKEAKHAQGLPFESIRTTTQAGNRKDPPWNGLKPVWGMGCPRISLLK